MWPGVGIAWILVNVSPKISSHSAGWIARVYSSVRSWRILRSSTQHSVTIRLARRPSPAVRLSGAIGGSTETAGGAPGAAYVTNASFLRRVVREGVAGVVPEHVIKRGVVTEPGAKVDGAAGGADRAAVHQRHPVAVGVGLVHVVGGHQHGHAMLLAQPGDVLPHDPAGDRIQADRRLVEHQQPGRV